VGIPDVRRQLLLDDVRDLGRRPPARIYVADEGNRYLSIRPNRPRNRQLRVAPDGHLHLIVDPDPVVGIDVLRRGHRHVALGSAPENRESRACDRDTVEFAHRPTRFIPPVAKFAIIAATMVARDFSSAGFGSWTTIRLTTPLSG